MTLAHFLASIGLGRLELDLSSVVLHRINGLIIALCVDELLLMGPDSIENRYLKEELGEKFCMNDLGPVSWYLGIRVMRDRKSRWRM